jgi:hypothetical protein
MPVPWACITEEPTWTGATGRQTKPECIRKQAGYENVIEASRIWTFDAKEATLGEQRTTQLLCPAAPTITKKPVDGRSYSVDGESPTPDCRFTIDNCRLCFWFVFNERQQDASLGSA